MLNISFKDRKIVPMFSSGDSTTPDFKQWTKEKLDEMQNYFNYDISDFIIESIRYVLFGIIPSKYHLLHWLLHPQASIRRKLQPPKEYMEV